MAYFTPKMMSLLILLAAGWKLGGATDTQRSHVYTHVGLDDKAFTEDVVFESSARSKLHCALMSNQQDSCIAFTLDNNVCRGHAAVMTSHSHFTPSAGARSYSKENNGLCNSLTHVVLSDARRDVTNDVHAGTVMMCDKNLTPGWYRFVLDGTNAVIPTECVPINHCGTAAPYWLDLQGNALPGAGQQTDARACAQWEGNCCFWEVPITVRNCGAFFVYKLKPYNHCDLSFCAKKVDS